MRIVVVGGGTATNCIVPVFSEIAEDITYVVPVSDNGGSTSEILRVFGGPAIGDARSRLTRLIQPGALRSLLEYRLSDDSQLANNDWLAIVGGTHSLWTELPPYMKAMYRAFLITVHAELLKKTTTMPAFDFRCASVGNLMLTGGRIFFGTLEAAIEFVLHTNRVPAHISVLPCINSSYSHHIAATLRNGDVVVGQSQISHPVSTSSGLGRMNSIHRRIASRGNDDDAHLYSHPSLRIPQINFTKTENTPLPSGIDQVYYINPYGDEIRPKLSPRLIIHLQKSDAVILSIGSLYTSIIPVLLLQGFAKNMPKKCILILNGSSDRETEGMSALDYLNAVSKALQYSLNTASTPKKFITNVIYPDGLPGSNMLKMDRNVSWEPASCHNGEYDNSSLAIAIKNCLG